MANIGNAVHKTLRSAQDLQKVGIITKEQEPIIEEVSKQYVIAVPPLFVQAMHSADDPIGRQVIPNENELVTLPDECDDPIGDERFSPLKGLIHRYEDRVLIKPILICPLYCRFCFRRQQVGGGEEAVLGNQSWLKIVEWLKAHTQVREVILSGGDPLMLSPRRMEMIIRVLEGIDHIKLIRFHTRVPVAAPQRINEEILTIFKNTSKTLWLAVHSNHSREFTPQACAAMRRLTQAGVSLVGQTVLLRGVNDSADALKELFYAMLDNKIRPYYLHQLDKAPGTNQFHVPVKEGLKIMEELRGNVTGLAWPTYVYDIPGGFGKVPLGPQYLKGENEIRDPQGKWHKIDNI